MVTIAAGILLAAAIMFLVYETVAALTEQCGKRRRMRVKLKEDTLFVVCGAALVTFIVLVVVAV